MENQKKKQISNKREGGEKKGGFFMNWDRGKCNLVAGKRYEEEPEGKLGKREH